VGAPPRDPRLDLNLETGKRGTRERRGKNKGQKGESTRKNREKGKIPSTPFCGNNINTNTFQHGIPVIVPADGHEDDLMIFLPLRWYCG
jgi:hypothetical protein